MTGRRIVAAVLAVLATVLAACGHKTEGVVVVADPTAEVLAHVPADADALLLAQTDPRHGAGAAVARLGARVPAAALVFGQAQAMLAARLGVDPERLRPLLGHPVALWSADASGTPRFAATVTRDADRLGALLAAETQARRLAAAGELDGYALFRRAGGGALARRGPILVAAPDLAALRGVLGRRVARRGQWTERLLAERRLGLPAGAAAELLTSARPPQARLDARVRFVGAIRRAAFTLAAERGGVRLRARVATDPAALTAADVPLAGGTAPPVTRGRGRLVAAVRDPQHLLAWLRAITDERSPHALDGLRTIEGLLGRYAGVSVQDDLVGHLAGTLKLATNDLRTGTARADLDDPDAVGGTLGRIGALARLGGPLAGLAGVDLMGYGVAERDGGEVLTRDGHDVVALAVEDGALAAATRPGADLGAVAAVPPLRGPAQGALRLSVAADLWHAEVVRRLGLPVLLRGALVPFGALTVGARTERTGLDAQAFVPVG